MSFQPCRRSIFLLLIVVLLVIGVKLLQDKTDKSTRFKLHSNIEKDTLNPSNKVFFVPGDLWVGKKLEIFFAKRDPSKTPLFLPKDKANSIPFSSSKLPQLLQILSLDSDSLQAVSMRDTLNMCEMKSVRGETKHCATSLESMLDFAVSFLGNKTRLSTLTNTILVKPSKQLQNYTILKEPTKLNSSTIVGCHSMPYPYAIYYCHGQSENGTAVFRVLVGGDDGGKILAPAICHMDTSAWNINHVSFKMLHMVPRSGSVCHFIQPDNIIWLASE